MGISHDEIGDVKKQPSETVRTDDHVVLAEPVFWNRSWKDALRVEVKVVFPH